MKAFVIAIALVSTAALAEDAKPADAATNPAAAKKAKAPVMMTAGDMKWAEIPDSHGLQVAAVQGNMMKGGAHAVFVKLPPGAQHPLHTHSADLKTVVISGTFTAGADDASAKEFGPGSYLFVPGGWKHVSGCKAGAECVLFQTGSGKFDMIPAGDAKPADAKSDDKK